MVFGETYSCAGKHQVFSSELISLSLRIINLKARCFWLRENIEFYIENSNFGKTHFSLERVFDENWYQVSKVFSFKKLACVTAASIFFRGEADVTQATRNLKHEIERVPFRTR